MELVTPGIGLLFWMLFAFSIVLVLLKRFAWKPILTALKEREDRIQDSLAQAEETRQKTAPPTQYTFQKPKKRLFYE